MMLRVQTVANVALGHGQAGQAEVIAAAAAAAAVSADVVGLVHLRCCCCLHEIQRWMG